VPRLAHGKRRQRLEKARLCQAVCDSQVTNDRGAPLCVVQEEDVVF
jgi:hypothetical protein